MKKYLSLIYISILLVFSLKVNASDIILEACNLISDSEKRLECFRRAISIDPSPKKIQDALVPLENAFTKIHAGRLVGLSYLEYQEALLNAAGELAIFSKSAPAESKAGIVLLEQALSQYKDARLIWSHAINNTPGWTQKLVVESRAIFWQKAADLAERGIKAIKDKGLPRKIFSLPNSDYANADGKVLATEEELVERLAVDIGCNSHPVAAKTISSDKFNEYTIYCSNGKILSFQCKFETCLVTPWPI